mgnify:CR=1 FL=1
MKVFTIERKGYSPREVDEYVCSLETQLNQKEAQLSEYRQKEAAINQSVVEAKLLANKIIEDAQAEAENIHKNALDSMADIKAQVKAMQEKLLMFQQDYNRILQQYLVVARCSDMVQIFDDLDHFMTTLGMNQQEEAVEVAELAAEAKQ